MCKWCHGWWMITSSSSIAQNPTCSSLPTLLWVAQSTPYEHNLDVTNHLALIVHSFVVLNVCNSHFLMLNSVSYISQWSILKYSFFQWPIIFINTYLRSLATMPICSLSYKNDQTFGLNSLKKSASNTWYCNIGSWMCIFQYQKFGGVEGRALDCS